MAKEIRVEVCESLEDCVGVMDNGDSVVIAGGSLFALPVYEDDGSGDVVHGPASDLRTLAKLPLGVFIKRGPTLMTFGTHSRPLACEKCGKCGECEGAHVRGFAGEDVVRLIRDSIAYKHLQERHSRLHDEKERLRSRQFAEIQKLREEVDRLNHQLDNVSKEREKLAGQVEGLKNLKVEVTGSEFVTIRGATSGETELASLRAENDRLQAELASLRLTSRPLFSHRQKIAALEKRAKESEAVAQGLADDIQKLNKKITELVSARSGDDVKIVSIEPLESPLGDVVKPRGLSCPKASDFYVTTRQPVFKPGALVGDSSVTEVCNLVSQEKIELNTVGLEVVYSGKFCYSEIPPTKLVTSVVTFSPAFVAELMAKADRYDKVEAIRAKVETLSPTVPEVRKTPEVNIPDFPEPVQQLGRLVSKYRHLVESCSFVLVEDTVTELRKLASSHNTFLNKKESELKPYFLKEKESELKQPEALVLVESLREADRMTFEALRVICHHNGPGPTSYSGPLFKEIRRLLGEAWEIHKRIGPKYQP